jgi:hypothetical protein
MTTNAWDPRASMLRRLGVAAALSEALALFVAGVFYLAGKWADPGTSYGFSEMSFHQAFDLGWAVFFLAFIPACLLYVRRSDVALNGDRLVRIAGARLDGRRSRLLRARSRLP